MADNKDPECRVPAPFVHQSTMHAAYTPRTAANNNFLIIPTANTRRTRCRSHSFLKTSSSSRPAALTKQPSELRSKQTMIFLRQATQTIVRRVAFAAPVSAARSSPFCNAVASLATVAGSSVASPFHAASPAPCHSSAMPSRGFADAAAVTTEQGGHSSPWKNFPMAPPDPIIGLTEVSEVIAVL